MLVIEFRCTIHVHLRIRTGLLTGLPRRHQDTWSRSRPSWYQKDWNPLSLLLPSLPPPPSPSFWRRYGVGGVHRLDPAGRSRHQLQRPVGQHGDMGRYQEKFLQIAPAEIWKLAKLLSSKTGSPSQTYKKISEANTKVYDLNQRTTQALYNLALVYATFEQAGANLELEFSEETCSSPMCVRQWKGGQQHQERAQGELERVSRHGTHGCEGIHKNLPRKG